MGTCQSMEGREGRDQKKSLLPPSAVAHTLGWHRTPLPKLMGASPCLLPVTEQGTW